MKHDRVSWTIQALTNRSDAIEHPGSVADILGGEDHRSVAVYYAHESGSFLGGVEGYWTGTAAEVIGVVIGGDDPHFPGEVLSRGQAQEMFGHDWVSAREISQTEGME